MISVLIVEDEPATARGLKLLITSHYPDFEVKALCSNGKEGLAQARALCPDLVFVDINMPLMSGLDMIRELKAEGFSPRFVILTGYSDFEYARSAMTLGITDYLLKPITTGKLDDIMDSCRSSHQMMQRLLQSEHLQCCLTGAKKTPGQKDPLLGFDCTFLFLFFGPMQNNIYNESIVPPELRGADQKIQAVLPALERQYRVSILPLLGRHHNEKVYGLVCPSAQEAPVAEIAGELYKTIHVTDSFVNLIISDTIRDGQNIRQTIQETYLFAMLHIPYGRSAITRCDAVTDQQIHVTSEARQLCTDISENPAKKELEEFIRRMIQYWKAARVSQYQLTSDLRLVVGTLIQRCAKENILYPDVAEIVSGAQSYEMLGTALQYELERIFHFHDEEIPSTQQQLVRMVRSWLDNNFTSQITYKIFQDIFGYNEKYISSLFKDEYGISPNRYVGRLRLDMAKRLMQNNPDMLLKDIASLTGFTDAFYFSRVFKTQEGISPNQYMKKIRDERELPGK